MPKVNLPEIDDLEAWIRAEAAKPVADSEWMQSVWTAKGKSVERNCGTVCCAAGRTVLKHGAKIVSEYSNYLLATDEEIADGVAVPYYGVPGDGPVPMVMTMRDRAARILGLEVWEADDLFYLGNKLPDMVDSFAEIRERAARDAAAEVKA